MGPIQELGFLGIRINGIQFEFRGIQDTGNTEDIQLWAIVVSCFFELIRIRNVAINARSSTNCVKRSDVLLSKHGGFINTSASNTMQYRDRIVQVPLPYLKQEICPHGDTKVHQGCWYCSSINSFIHHRQSRSPNIIISTICSPPTINFNNTARSPC